MSTDRATGTLLVGVGQKWGKGHVTIKREKQKTLICHIWGSEEKYTIYRPKQYDSPLLTVSKSREGRQ